MNLIKGNEKLVYSISNMFQKKYNGFDADDLAQVGFLTLLKSGHKYDPSRGVASTFITHCVTNAINGHIKRNFVSNRSYTNVEGFDSIPSNEEDFSLDEYFPDPTSIEVSICKFLQDGCSKKEISRKTGTSVWLINKIISKIKERLKVYEKKTSPNGHRGHIS